MRFRFDSIDEFRQAVASLGLPLTEDELQTVWPMVRDLHDQADGLRSFLDMHKTGVAAGAAEHRGDR